MPQHTISMHTHKKKTWKLKGDFLGRGRGPMGEDTGDKWGSLGEGYEYDQSILYTCIKMS
jgi:hypothetical protein